MWGIWLSTEEDIYKKFLLGMVGQECKTTDVSWNHAKQILIINEKITVFRIEAFAFKEKRKKICGKVIFLVFSILEKEKLLLISWIEVLISQMFLKLS